MVDKFSRLNNIGSKAALSEQSESDALVTKKKLVSLPVKAEERFNALKKAGKVSGSFNAYIVQATLNNLERDENK